MYDLMDLDIPAFSTFVMNSAELTDYLIEDFKEKIDEGYAPDDVKYEVFAGRNASTDDLTDLDKDRLVTTISEYWEAYND